MGERRRRFVSLGILLLFCGSGAPASTALPAMPEIPPEPFTAARRGDPRVALTGLLLAGFLAFSLEIVWTRFFGLVFASSSDSFAVILAAFISGIAIGAAWLGRNEGRLRDPLAALGWTQLLLGLAVILPLPWYPYLPWLFQRFQGHLLRIDGVESGGYSHSQGTARTRSVSC